MAFYLLTVQLFSGQVLKRIKEIDEADIDILYDQYQKIAMTRYKKMLAEFDIFLVSRRSKLVEDYLSKPPELKVVKGGKIDIDAYIRNVYNNHKGTQNETD